MGDWWLGSEGSERRGCGGSSGAAMSFSLGGCVHSGVGGECVIPTSVFSGGSRLRSAVIGLRDLGVVVVLMLAAL